MNEFQALPGRRTMLVTAAATSRPRSAVIMLHGYTATPAGEEAVSGWTQFMARTNALVAYPEGTPTPYGGYGWTTGAAHFATTGTDDVADTNNVITYLVAHDCVNRKQIMIAGESNGSGLGLILGCNKAISPKVRLFALAIPAVDQNVLAHCNGDHTPFPLLVIASLKDATVPYDGLDADNQIAFLPPLAWFTQVATAVDGCVGLQEGIVQDGIHYWYKTCKAAANFYVALDGYHTWPGGPEGAGGLNPGKFPASELSWCASSLKADPWPSVECKAITETYGLAKEQIVTPPVRA